MTPDRIDNLGEFLADPFPGQDPEPTFHCVHNGALRPACESCAERIAKHVPPTTEEVEAFEGRLKARTQSRHVRIANGQAPPPAAPALVQAVVQAEPDHTDSPAIDRIAGQAAQAEHFERLFRANPEAAPQKSGEPDLLAANRVAWIRRELETLLAREQAGCDRCRGLLERAHTLYHAHSLRAAELELYLRLPDDWLPVALPTGILREGMQCQEGVAQA